MWEVKTTVTGFSFVQSQVNIFDLSPEVLGLYGLIGAAGAICIGVAWLEQRLFGGQFSYIAAAINGLVRVALPLSYAILLLRFLTAL